MSNPNDTYEEPSGKQAKQGEVNLARDLLQTALKGVEEISKNSLTKGRHIA